MNAAMAQGEASPLGAMCPGGRKAGTEPREVLGAIGLQPASCKRFDDTTMPSSSAYR